MKENAHQGAEREHQHQKGITNLWYNDWFTQNYGEYY